MSIITQTVNYIRESNKETLAEYIAEEVISLENNIETAKIQIANQQKRIDALTAIDFTDKEAIRSLLRGSPLVLINGKQYNIIELVNSLPT
jgi:hypothetical protein